MDIQKLKKILVNEPKFRIKQIEQEIYSSLIDNWSQATTLPKNLIEILQQEYPIDIKADLFISADQQSAKALITLVDDKRIETVLMRHENRNTVCVSSQVGCSMACDFCATGKLGLKCNLTAEEIVSQVLLFQRYLKKDHERVSSVVFMGMGEPFLNYENVIAAIEILNDKNKFNIGARHISISSCGIIGGIKKIADFPKQINLAISLHAPTDKLRTRLMPINKKYPLLNVLLATKNYIDKTKRKVMIEYIMLQDVNDAPAQAEELAELLKNNLQHLFFINLIAYNSNGQNKYQPSAPATIQIFKDILEKSGLTVTQRYKMGQDIKGACGQLAYQK